MQIFYQNYLGGQKQKGLPTLSADLDDKAAMLIGESEYIWLPLLVKKNCSWRR